MKRVIWVTSMVFFMSGCATQAFVFDASADAAPHEKTSHFFISGLGQEDIVDPVKICGSKDKVVRVESHLSFLDGFLGLLTYGIYTPRQMTVYCRK